MAGKKNDASTHGRWYGKSTIYGAEDGEKQTPYMVRYWIGRLRFHIFYRGDADPDCHDHPWDFWTFPLTPYVEEVLAPKLVAMVRDKSEVFKESTICPSNSKVRYRQVVPRLKITFRPGTHAHRVLGRASVWAGGLYKQKPRVASGNRVPDGVPDALLFDPRPIYTIVWRTAPKNGPRNWGFFKNTDNRWCFDNFVKYIREGGKNAPCE